ncbi:MAG TPA: endo alpha-1,4 polygalactosaminidase [Polyangiaceae bacterium]
MRATIVCCAVFLGSVASGCSGSSEDPSESGQGGASAMGGKPSSTAAAGGKYLGGSNSGGGQLGIGAQSAAVGGALTTGGVSSVIDSGGNNATTLEPGVAGNAGRGSFGSTSKGGSTAKGGSASSGGSNANSSKAGSSASGNHTGGANNGGAATAGGVASAGKSAGSSANGGAASGGKGNGGSNPSAAGKASVGGATGVAGAGANAAIVLPEANASFDYQIGGAYTPPTGVRVVSRDRNSAPAAGPYNICYVNGFQIQPDEESFWSSQHPSLILKDGSGNPVVDEDWGETLLDTSTAAKRTELATVIGGWITKCKADGFNAVEIDNLDSYSRSNGLLSVANNVAFMTLLSNAAHTSGLAIAQKNSSELLGSVATMKTDFAVVEECNRYSECDQYQAAYGNLVFIIEYRQQDFQKGCSAYPELSIVLRNLDVSAPGSSGYVYQGC